MPKIKAPKGAIFLSLSDTASYEPQTGLANKYKRLKTRIMPGKFVIKKTQNAQFHFVLKAGNSETILSSETYTQKSGALNGIQSVKNNAPDDSRYERRDSDGRQPYYFVLKAGNGEIIGTSEMYSSTSGRDNGIASVKTNAPNATIDDET